MTTNEIVNNLEKIIDDVKHLTRDQKSKIIKSLKQEKVSKLNPDQIENLIKFLTLKNNGEYIFNKDDIGSYLLHVMDTEYSTIDTSKENEIVEMFLSDERLRNLIAD